MGVLISTFAGSREDFQPAVFPSCAPVLSFKAKERSMLELMSSIHLFAGLVWAAGLFSSISGAVPPASGSGGGFPLQKIARFSGALLVLTGLLRAAGSASFDETKAVFGLYGLAIMVSLVLFSLLITLARSVSAANPRIQARYANAALLCGLAAFSGLMVIMAHWPFTS